MFAQQRFGQLTFKEKEMRLAVVVRSLTILTSIMMFTGLHAFAQGQGKTIVFSTKSKEAREPPCRPSK
jgi:hypothetical protein